MHHPLLTFDRVEEVIHTENDSPLHTLGIMATVKFMTFFFFFMKKRETKRGERKNIENENIHNVDKSFLVREFWDEKKKKKWENE